MAKHGLECSLSKAAGTDEQDEISSVSYEFAYIVCLIDIIATTFPYNLEICLPDRQCYLGIDNYTGQAEEKEYQFLPFFPR